MRHHELRPGVVLGRYELLLPIAQGGMATVWAARQKGSRGFQKTVAVKTMLPGLTDDPQFEQMFLDEATLASKVHHPNVAEILDVGEEGDVLYIVMEWVDGEALSVIAKAARKSQTLVPQRIVLRVLGQACAGLHAAHELRDDDGHLLELVHRDVSPQNILVTYDGAVKLVDFGVAKAIGRAGGETTAGQLKGKVPYMSPEQAKGGKVDRRTDVFAMGIVLYKLTVGVHPFLGASDMQTMQHIIGRPLLSPRMKYPSFPPELEKVLLKCLEKDPDKRFQTVADLDRALDRVLGATGVSVVDDDVGSLVRTLLGDRGQKRRASLREAVKRADLRAAGHPTSSPRMTPVVHEAVSDLLVTQLATAVDEEMLPDRLSDLGTPPPPPRDRPLGAMHEAGMVFSGIPRRGPSPALLVGATAAVVAAIGLGVVLLRTARGSGAEARPTSAASAMSPGVAVPTAPAPPPAAESSAAASAVSVTDLPSQDDRVPPPASGGRRSSGGAAPGAGTSTTVAPPRATVRVPSVQNPGF
jgi:serine/threonine-protein kinase